MAAASSVSFCSLVPALVLVLLAMAMSSSNAQPSPGYYPSSRSRPMAFSRGYSNKWGPQHQTVSGDQSSLTIWLDKSCGSGFKSKQPYRNGYFAARIKLPGGYTAGTNTAFYLSNNEAHPGSHDEIDMEFLGTIPGEPYTLQTNVYVRGSGDGRIIGREMRFHLWFDPTADFHNYAILWNPDAITFFVDDVPIRRYERKTELTFPDRPMWVYGSIWDASDWATDDGRHRADYRYQPFIARFNRVCASVGDSGSSSAVAGSRSFYVQASRVRPDSRCQKEKKAIQVFVLERSSRRGRPEGSLLRRGPVALGLRRAQADLGVSVMYLYFGLARPAVKTGC